MGNGAAYIPEMIQEIFKIVLNNYLIIIILSLRRGLRMKKLKNFGFTIVELIIIVVVIGILLGIAIPNYIRSLEIAKCSQAIVVLKKMRLAAIDYFQENETFTTMDIAALNAQIGASFANTKDWEFDNPVPVTTASTFTLTATRTSGPHGAGTIITLSELEIWGGNYPYDDPGNF